MDLQAIEKLAAARTRLILDKPFLGALVLRLPMAAADPNWVRPPPPTRASSTTTRSTSTRCRCHRPSSCSRTRHCIARSHTSPVVSNRIQHRWDLACDYAINPLLLDDGLTPPPNCHVMPQYLGMTAEEIYPLIDENDQSDTIDQHLFDQDNQSGGGQQGQAPTSRKANSSNPAGGTSSQPEDDGDQGGERPLDQPSQQQEGQWRTADGRRCRTLDRAATARR